LITVPCPVLSAPLIVRLPKLSSDPKPLLPLPRKKKLSSAAVNVLPLPAVLATESAAAFAESVTPTMAVPVPPLPPTDSAAMA